MQSNKGTYLLSMIDHKGKVLIGDIELVIANWMENNLRERNPQLGIVETIPDDNYLKLEIGDIVACHHFTFCMDISKDNKFSWNPNHAEIDGIKYFKVNEDQIYFKYNNKTPELLPGYILCENIKMEDKLNFDANSGVISRTKEFPYIGNISYGSDKYPTGSIVKVLKNSFYGIRLDGVDYYRVRESEVVAILEPFKVTGNYFLIEDIDDEIKHDFLDLSQMKKSKTIKSILIDIGDDIKKIKSKNSSDYYYNVNGRMICGEIGCELLTYRNQGVLHEGKRLVEADTIVGWIDNNKTGINSLKI